MAADDRFSDNPFEETQKAKTQEQSDERDSSKNKSLHGNDLQKRQDHHQTSSEA